MSQETLDRAVARTRQGDSEAWAEVYRELAPSVYRMCRRVLPNREDAEDATGEVLLKARARLDQYDPGRPFKAWIYGIAANHCWDELRKRRGRGELDAPELESEHLETSEPDPHEKLLVRQTSQQVRTGLTKLDLRGRLILTMRYFADMSYEEIAEVLGISSTLVGVLLLRARRKMRRILTDMSQQ